MIDLASNKEKYVLGTQFFGSWILHSTYGEGWYRRQTACWNVDIRDYVGNCQRSKFTA
jgi:hypothetical protein